MSTVLTNGIIIPDNGSRNWGGDLANNWNIIDVNVGYMNDVKNKVTTLENSVAENTADIQTNASNISALQTGKQDVIEDLETIRTGASSGATAVQPSALSDYYTKAETDTALTSKANDSDVVHKSGNETVNGTKTFSNIFLKSSRIERGALPSSNITEDNEIKIVDKNNKQILGIFNYYYTNGDSKTSFYAYNLNTTDYDNIAISFNFDNANNQKNLTPIFNNTVNLGTSVLKWKTLNGVNPGALSIPKYDQYVTLTFQLETQIQATFTGFLQVKANVSSGAYLIVTINNVEVAAASPSANIGHILVPITKNDQIYVTVTNGEYLGYGSLIIFKAQGNV